MNSNEFFSIDVSILRGLSRMTDLHEHAAASGITLPEKFPMDGSIFRFSTNGSKKKNGFLKYHINPDESHVCWYGDWVDYQPDNALVWCNRDQKEMSEKERRKHEAFIKKCRKKERADREKRYVAAARKAKDLLNRANDADPNHPYLTAKGIKPHIGIRQHNNTLLVPVRDPGGKIISLQQIYPDGTKRFLKGGKTAGGCFGIRGDESKPIHLAEGYTTGATIHKGTGATTVVAFNAGNLLAVAKSIRSKYPDKEVIICADNDQWADGNPGVTKATVAANEINARVAIPKFKGVASKPTDFNDLMLIEGIETVSRQLRNTESQNNGIKISFI